MVRDNPDPHTAAPYTRFIKSKHFQSRDVLSPEAGTESPARRPTGLKLSFVASRANGSTIIHVPSSASVSNTDGRCNHLTATTFFPEVKNNRRPACRSIGCPPVNVPKAGRIAQHFSSNTKHGTRTVERS